MGEDTEEGTTFLPALFLKPPSEGGKPAIWTGCQVQSYDESSNRFTVLYKEGVGTAIALKALVPRIHLCFRAEDPFIFRDRVVAAYAAREAAEASVRHSLYIECMPTEVCSTQAAARKQQQHARKQHAAGAQPSL